MTNTYDIQKFLESGKKVEDRFALYLEKWGNVNHASKDEDINEHWDLRLDPEDPYCPFIKPYYGFYLTFDVKSLKSRKRKEDKDESIHYIEFKNVQGNDGWLYGKATYIVFEKFNCYVVVDRVELVKAMEPFKNEMILDAPRLYFRYNRNNRGDLTMMVETNFIEEISHLIIKKENKYEI